MLLSVDPLADLTYTCLPKADFMTRDLNLLDICTNGARTGSRTKQDGRMSEADPSARVVSQRIRNRIIESIELAGSFQSQLDYEKNVPFVNVPYEVINQWEDWVRGDPRIDEQLSDALSNDELDAMADYQSVWNVVADAVPDDYPSLADVQALPTWDQLRIAANVALIVFEIRGRMSEDAEEAQ